MQSVPLNHLLRKPILRSPAARLLLLQNGKLPRYRVRIPPDAKDLLVGAKVAGRYYVLSVLGHGGMSVVYKAKTINKGRIVALKTLRMQGLNDELVVKRFQREAELLSGLNHPRIVQVYDYGTTARGQPYFVMDYLQGVNLSSIIKHDGPLDAVRFQHIFLQVCGAVDHAHRCGVIHRDLKPGNIMLSRQRGQKDFVKVVDFGIARFEEEAQRLTRFGEVWGSPIYMSPEQCMGAPLDARSDIYSVGIVMYEALTGFVPFFGKNYVDTMTKQISSPPQSMKEARPDLNIPAKIEVIVMKALSKEPDARFQTMGEMKEELENIFPNAPKRPGTLDNIPARKDTRSSPPITTPGQKDTRPPAPKEQPRSLRGMTAQPSSGIRPRTIGSIIIVVAILLVIVAVVSSLWADLKPPPSSNLPSSLAPPFTGDIVRPPEESKPTSGSVSPTPGLVVPSTPVPPSPLPHVHAVKKSVSKPLMKAPSYDGRSE
jgi:serine/threonine-protein kinase